MRRRLRQHFGTGATHKGYLYHLRPEPAPQNSLIYRDVYVFDNVTLMQILRSNFAPEDSYITLIINQFHITLKK